MANAQPTQSEGFLSQQFPKVADKALGKPIAVRFPVEIDAALRGMPGMQDYIRAAMGEVLTRDGLI